MEKITEISTKLEDKSAFEVILICKALAKHIDICNVIIDNMSIDEKENLINMIEGIRSLNVEIIEEPYFIKPEAKA